MLTNFYCIRVRFAIVVEYCVPGVCVLSEMARILRTIGGGGGHKGVARYLDKKYL